MKREGTLTLAVFSQMLTVFPESSTNSNLLARTTAGAALELEAPLVMMTPATTPRNADNKQWIQGFWNMFFSLLLVSFDDPSPSAAFVVYLQSLLSQSEMAEVSYASVGLRP